MVQKRRYSENLVLSSFGLPVPLFSSGSGPYYLALMCSSRDIKYNTECKKHALPFFFSFKNGDMFFTLLIALNYKA